MVSARPSRSSPSTRASAIACVMRRGMAGGGTSWHCWTSTANWSTAAVSTVPPCTHLCIRPPTTGHRERWWRHCYAGEPGGRFGTPTRSDPSTSPGASATFASCVASSRFTSTWCPRACSPRSSDTCTRSSLDASRWCLAGRRSGCPSWSLCSRWRRLPTGSLSRACTEASHALSKRGERHRAWSWRVGAGWWAARVSVTWCLQRALPSSTRGSSERSGVSESGPRRVLCVSRPV